MWKFLTTMCMPHITCSKIISTMKPSTSFKLVSILSPCFILFYQIVLSEAVVRNVITALQFQHALDNAMPGDIIKLRSDEIFFEGKQFTASKSGEAGDPITITGSTTQNGFASIELEPTSNSMGTTGLTISGDYWKLEGIELLISKPYTGVRIEGNNNSLSSLLITAYETGVYITGNGNILTDSIIKSTHGTGIYLSGDENNITSNVVGGSEWGVYLTNDTCCGEIASNTVTGPVMVQGSSHSFKDNVISGDLLVSDCSDNHFSGLIVRSTNPPTLPESCSLLLDNEAIIYVY